MIDHSLNESSWPDLRARSTVLSRTMTLELCVRMAYRIPGDIIEFGVARGGSTRVLRRVLSECERGQIGGARKTIYACDSFKGLREKFENAQIGAFACEVPNIPGVQIVEGYFEDSLTPALARRVGRVALASLDADLYSATLCALRWLTPLLQSGSLLLFDEYLGEQASERRAHEDWLRESGLRTIQLAEFLREPSGWGSTPDRRVLAQVIGPEVFTPLSPRRIQSMVMGIARTLGVVRP
jgi:hypothetical protein